MALPWNDLSLVIAIEVAAFAFVEVARQNQEAKSLARLYPGGARPVRKKGGVGGNANLVAHNRPPLPSS